MSAKWVMPVGILIMWASAFCTPAYADVTASEPETASLTAIIGDPSRFAGKKVRVAGWLHHRFEDNALYLTQFDSDNSININALWLRYGQHSPKCTPPSEQGSGYFDGRPVWVVGTFDRAMHGHMGAYSGCLTDCQSIELIRKPGNDRYHVGD